MQGWYVFAGFPCRVLADNRELSLIFLAFIGLAAVVLWFVKRRMSARVFRRSLIGLGIAVSILVAWWAVAYFYFFCMGKAIFW